MKATLFTIFAVLWFADATLTSILVVRHGNEIEANPFMLMVLNYFGIAGLWAFKAITLGFWYKVNLWYTRDTGKVVTPLIDIIFILFTAFAVVIGAIMVFEL